MCIRDRGDDVPVTWIGQNRVIIIEQRLLDHVCVGEAGIGWVPEKIQRRVVAILVLVFRPGRGKRVGVKLGGRERREQFDDIHSRALGEFGQRFEHWLNIDALAGLAPIAGQRVDIRIGSDMETKQEGRLPQQRFHQPRFLIGALQGVENGRRIAENGQVAVGKGKLPDQAEGCLLYTSRCV